MDVVAHRLGSKGDRCVAAGQCGGCCIQHFTSAQVQGHRICRVDSLGAMAAPLAIILFCLTVEEDTILQGLCRMMGELGRH
eukprot:6971356-Ditylum_brightwellii.AAC.1